MLNQPEFDQPKQSKGRLLIWLCILLVLVSMACSLSRVEAKRPSRRPNWIIITLPTVTPTAVTIVLALVTAEPPVTQADVSTNDEVPIAEATPTLAPAATTRAMAEPPPQPVDSSAPSAPDPLPSPTPASAPTEALDSPAPPPPPTPSPSPEPNPAPGGSGWNFVGVQVSYQDEEGVIIDGDIINNTGAPQEIVKLTGTVYDSQGQGIASVDDAAAYWPLEIVPPGGQVPFEMAVYHVQDITDFDLDVVSQPSRENPRQDFELSDLAPSIDEGNYCVTGKLWNRGDPLLDYLLILVVLYNDQDKVVNFGIFQGNSPEEVLNDEALNFEVCTDSYNHQIARHELRAVGL